MSAPRVRDKAVSIPFAISESFSKEGRASLREARSFGRTVPKAIRVAILSKSGIIFKTFW